MLNKAYANAIILFAVSLIGATILTGCGPKAPEDKVAAQLALLHPLTAEERNLAQANAKNYFNQEWLPAGGKRGQLINCKPSDSNHNGLVTCNGYIPNAAGTFNETVMYCGYLPALVGCSKEDTVK